MPIVPIDRTLGTNIGDMTAQAGLAAAFDGVSITSIGNCAQLANSRRGWVGKTLAIARRFWSATVYPPSTGTLAQRGFVTGGSGTVTLNIRGKQGSAPSSRTDGTIVGTITVDNEQTDPADISTTDAVTVWDHLFVDYDGGVGASREVNCAELVLRTPVPSPQAIIIV